MSFKIDALKNSEIFWIKKSIQHRCFSLNIAKFLKTAILQSFSRHTGIPGLWTQELDVGLWTLDSRRWTLDSGRWTLDAGR